MKTKTSSRLGFSLLEVSLAVIIASIALISIISMLPASLDASRKAKEATRAGQLADDILSGVLAAAQQFPKYSSFKSGFVQGDPSLEFDVSSKTLWDSSKSTAPPTLIADGIRHKIEFAPKMDNGSDTFVTHGAWYLVTIKPVNANNSLVKRIRVEVWPNIIYKDKNDTKNRVVVEAFVNCPDMQNDLTL